MKYTVQVHAAMAATQLCFVFVFAPYIIYIFSSKDVKPKIILQIHLHLYLHILSFPEHGHYGCSVLTIYCILYLNKPQTVNSPIRTLHPHMLYQGIRTSQIREGLLSGTPFFSQRGEPLHRAAPNLNSARPCAKWSFIHLNWCHVIQTCREKCGHSQLLQLLGVSTA